MTGEIVLAISGKGKEEQQGSGGLVRDAMKDCSVETVTQGRLQPGASASHTLTILRLAHPIQSTYEADYRD